MSEASAAARRAREHDEHDASAPVVLPQWTFEMARPVVRTLSRVLWHMRFHGVENIPARGGVVIAANHQTYIDPFWISVPVRRPVRYLAWDEAFRWPLMGKPMELLGAWPIPINSASPTAVRRTLHFLREGGAVMIFPEGGRCEPDGAMKRFKLGAVRIALEADVQILPVTICGAHRVWPKTQIFPRFAPVEIIYHPPYKATPHADEEARQCARRETDQLAEIIRAVL